VLDRAQLSGYVDIFRGEHLGWAPLADRVRQWWDLDDLGARYARFVAQHRPLARRVTSRAPDPADAFADYVRMLTVWRGLRYRDPGLPVEVLPARWVGGQAATLFTTLNQVLRPLAHRHAMHLLHD
jgi:phenylacetic acid degradation operon negative regulatory protein